MKLKFLGKSVKHKRDKKVTMVEKLIIWCFIFCALLNNVQDTNASVLTVENGVYKRLTVQVSEAVPRQLCHRAINNLQVRNLYYIYKFLLQTNIYHV